MSKELREKQENMQEKKAAPIEESKTNTIKGKCKGCHKDCDKCTCKHSSSCGLKTKE